MIFVKKVALSRNLFKYSKFFLQRRIHINNPYIGYYLPSKRLFSNIAIQNIQPEVFIEDTYINSTNENIYDEPTQPPGNNNDDDPSHEDSEDDYLRLVLRIYLAMFLGYLFGKAIGHLKIKYEML